ncbi:MAG: L-dopachrome tautomerase-related protein [Woeseiaceae bacterium]|nr:L-dopachrome tautomerase-related protein [Woeseiaceae bacterium]
MKKVLLFFVLCAIGLTAVAWIRYGGGKPYPNLSTPPLMSSASVEEFLSYPEPIGNVAVSLDGRVFFTVHPESRPQGNRVLEYVNGAAEPFPNMELQLEYFDTPLGIHADGFGRLWTLDHGNHGLRVPRLLGFDIETGQLIHDEAFPPHIAPAGSYLQDLRVSVDGKTIVIADASFWRKSPALIVYDIDSGSTRRVLERDPSVVAENYLIQTGDRKMSFLGGIVSLRGGVDAIALGPEWLYFGAISGSGLYRVRLSDLKERRLPEAQLSGRVERYATKPLANGMAIDNNGLLYVTGIEHNSVFVIDGKREAKTLVQSADLRWPEAMAFGPDGWLYVADSALSELLLKSPEHIRAQQPYRIFRFRPFAKDAAESVAEEAATR